MFLSLKYRISPFEVSFQKSIHIRQFQEVYYGKIVATRKMENGIACYYGEKGKEEFETFNYSELIDMKINALDLLNDPRNYAVDPEITG